MDFKKLKYVLTVAEVQSISKAAAILYISQPSLSHIISNLETELGVQIFNRTTTPISLTYAGEKFVQTAKEILNMNNKLTKEFSDISGLKKGRISIGIPSLRGSFILPYVLPLFHEKYPGIELVLVEGNSQELEHSLLNGKVNIVFTIIPFLNNQIIHEVIGKEQIKVACKKGYLSKAYILEGTENVVDFAKLKDLDFILTKKGHRIRDYVDKLFDINGLKPNIILETSNSGTAYRLATAGMGVCFAAEMTINSTKAVGEYELYKIDSVSNGWEIGALYRKDAYLTSAEKDLIDMMRDVLKKHNRNE
jgi:DNA-binding transcriptional LysR family regulator